MPGPSTPLTDSLSQPSTGQMAARWASLPGHQRQIPASPANGPCCIPDRACSPSHVTGCQSVLLAFAMRPRGGLGPLGTLAEQGNWQVPALWTMFVSTATAVCPSLRGSGRISGGPPPCRPRSLVEYHDFCHGLATPRWKSAAVPRSLCGAQAVGPPDSMGRYGGESLS